MKRLEYIKVVANKFIKLLKPYVSRISVAGSIRRGELEPNDIEIVAIPKDLYKLKEVMDTQYYVKGKFPSKYSQIKFQCEKIDIFWCNKDNWGNIFLIRTGDWHFSKWIMGTKTKEAGLIQKEGCLWRGNERLSCLEEKDVFKLLGMDYIEPEKRER